ncbi:hypothetical protein [Promicromonospora sp. NPDC050880]|uniref:hypothetical protein n=1 Tax=Promicromonospora sp. NPDC050880 TaxID=3364406 RepID=UPI0037A548C4
MFGRRRQITKKDYPDLLMEMARDLENVRVMVGRMNDWADQIDQGDLADGLYEAGQSLKDAQGDAERAARKVADELEKEARDR